MAEAEAEAAQIFSLGNISRTVAQFKKVVSSDPPKSGSAHPMNIFSEPPVTPLGALGVPPGNPRAPKSSFGEHGQTVAPIKKVVSSDHP